MSKKLLITKDREDSRTLYFDVLNVLGTLFVVWIHFGNEVHWYDGSTVWYWCLFIQVIAYWAVPVFFMLTGATLMDYQKKDSTKTFFIRRFRKTVIPYLFWGAIISLVKIKRGSIQIPYDGKISQLLYSISDLFLHNQMESIYWFFPVIFGIYLCIPALSVFSEPKNRKKLDYLVGVGVLTISVIPFLYRMVREYFLVSGIGWNGALELPVLGSYLIYPILGYWAATRNFTKRERILCYIVAMACAVMRYSGLAFLSERDGVTNQLYMDYKGFPALFLALGVFVFVRYVCEHLSKILKSYSRVFAVLSSCSFGVYLLHNLLLDKMAAMPFFAKYSVQWYFFWPFICYFACVAIVFVGKKLPLIKRILP